MDTNSNKMSKRSSFVSIVAVNGKMKKGIGKAHWFRISPAQAQALHCDCIEAGRISNHNVTYLFRRLP